jgi:hypothetical protein
MRRSVVTLLVIGLFCMGCTADSTDEGFQLDEFTIEGPDSLAVGGNDLTISNVGEFPHTLVITDATGHVVAASDLIQPGEIANLAVDVAEGQYVFTCRIVAQNDAGEIVDHFEAGMTATVDVSG